jgi:flagellar hook assembly protein FlgD
MFYFVASEAGEVAFSISNADGEQVGGMTEEAVVGLNSVEWNLIGSNDEMVSEGEYTVTISQGDASSEATLTIK